MFITDHHQTDGRTDRLKIWYWSRMQMLKEVLKLAFSYVLQKFWQNEYVCTLVRWIQSKQHEIWREINEMENNWTLGVSSGTDTYDILTMPSWLVKITFALLQVHCFRKDLHHIFVYMLLLTTCVMESICWCTQHLPHVYTSLYIDTIQFIRT